MKFTLYALIALTQTAKVSATDASDYGGVEIGNFTSFTSIAGDYGSVESVVIDLSCPPNQNIKLPNLMFTIKSGDAADVSSSPSDAVKATVNDGVLSFTYNLEAASNSGGGGVQITLPADALKKLTISGQNTAQVLNGFTSLEHIKANGQSTLTATATSSTSKIQLDADGESTVDLVSNVNLVTSSGITGQSTVQVQTPFFKDISVGGQATLSIDGGIEGGTVQGESTVTVSGDITGMVQATGQSTIEANTITGTITASKQSSVTTSKTCDDVVTTEQASCDVESAPSVSVDATEGRLFSIGSICYNQEGSSETYNDDNFSCGSGLSSTVAIVTASLVAAAAATQAI